MLAVALQSHPPAEPWTLVSALKMFDRLPSSVTCARQHATRMLRTCELARLADEAQLIVSELVTNAIQHGAEPVTVLLWAHYESLLIEVWDASSAPPKPRAHADDAVRGRGLQIVARLSHGWGYYPDGGGKTVWAVLA